MKKTLRGIREIWLIALFMLAGILLISVGSTNEDFALWYDIGIGIASSALVAILIYLTTILKERKRTLRSFIYVLQSYLRNVKFEIDQLIFERLIRECECKNQEIEYNWAEHEVSTAVLERQLNQLPVFELADIAEDELVQIYSEISNVTNVIQCNMQVASPNRLREMSANIYKLKIKLAKYENGFSSGDML